MPDSWDYTQRRARPGSDAPILTAFLCALCVLVTTMHLALAPGGNPLWARIASIGYSKPFDVWDGKYWYLFTDIFAHGDWLHLFFNMLWLFHLGRILEATLKPLTYFAILLAAALVSSGCELAWSGVTGIGASGVVYALFGMMWAGRGSFDAWRAVATRDNLNYFLGWGVFCIVASHFGWLHIANAAHFGGLLFGLALGWLFFSPRRRPLWGIPLAALLVVTALSITWMPWSGLWCIWKAAHEEERGHQQSADYWGQRAERLLGPIPDTTKDDTP